MDAVLNTTHRLSQFSAKIVPQRTSHPIARWSEYFGQVHTTIGGMVRAGAGGCCERTYPNSPVGREGLERSDDALTIDPGPAAQAQRASRALALARPTKADPWRHRPR